MSSRRLNSVATLKRHFYEAVTKWSVLIRYTLSLLGTNLVWRRLGKSSKILILVQNESATDKQTDIQTKRHTNRMTERHTEIIVYAESISNILPTFNSEVE